MKILDRYLLKRFLVTYVFVVAVLLAVICVIDYAEKYDNFKNHNLSGKVILFDYYLNFIPYMANVLSPITIFIATVFMTARLASHTEFIAMLSSGISFKRLLIPYLAGASVIAVCIFALLGWIIPNGNKTRIAFEKAYIKAPFEFNQRNIHIKLSLNTYAYMESYDIRSNTGYKFTLEKIEGTELKEKLSANSIVWKPDKKKWYISNYTLRKFDGMKELLVEKTGLDTTLNMHPEDFQSKYMENETLTLPELTTYIETLRMRGSEGIEVYLIDKYERFTYPFSILILTLIGVVVSATKTRGGAGFKIAFGFLLAFIYLIFVMISRAVGKGGTVNPLITVWVPNVVFTIIGLIMYKKMPK